MAFSNFDKLLLTKEIVANLLFIYFEVQLDTYISEVQKDVRES